MGAAAMSLSSIFVVMNALRLNFFKSEKISPVAGNAYVNTDVQQTAEKGGCDKEDKMSTMTVKIDGMMCPKCEAHVKEALEKLDGVTSVTASRGSASACMEITTAPSEEAVKAAVEDAGYTFMGIE